MTEVAANTTFKKAIATSLIAHFTVFLLLIISPKLPKPSRKGMVHYIPLDMVVAGGGGGGAGRGGLPAGKPVTAPAKKETLRDLTVPQKIKKESESSLRYPVEKPKKEHKTRTEKKEVVTKPEPSSPEKGRGEEEALSGAVGGEGTGTGSGLRIGGGGGPGGEGFGAGFGPGFGLGNFPYHYYLNIITERVSANWFTSLVDPMVGGNFQTVIYFRIQKNGQITNLEVEKSSGLTPLDLSALRAVRASAPFPPLPREYQEAYLAIHLIFEHSR